MSRRLTTPQNKNDTGFAKRCTEYDVAASVGKRKGRKVRKECIKNVLKRFEYGSSMADTSERLTALGWNPNLND